MITKSKQKYILPYKKSYALIKEFKFIYDLAYNKS